MNQEAKEKDGKPSAEEKLRKANERLYTLMKAFQVAAAESDSLVFTYDTKKQTIVVDEETAKRFGVAAVQEGVPYEMVRIGVVSRDTVGEYLRIHEEMIKGAREAGGIVKLIQADGTSIVHELKFKAIMNEDGENTGTAVGIYRNITQRHIRDRELDRYRQMFYAVKRYTYQYDAAIDELVIFVSDSQKPESAYTTQYRLSAFMPRMLRGEFCPKADVKILQEVFTNGVREMVQVQLHSPKTGELRWYGVTGMKGQEGSGCQSDLGLIFGTLVDLTEYKEKEIAYRKLERILEGLRDDCIGIFEIDLEKDYCEMLSFSDRASMLPVAHKGCYSRMTQKIAEELVMEEHRASFLQACDRRRLQEQLAKSKRVEVEFRTVTGEESWQRSSFQALEYENDIPVKAVLYQTNIDSIKAEALKQQQAIYEAYRFAEAANTAKTEFLSRMSHDIRTPMNAIIGMTAIAGAHLDNPDRVKECLSKISTSSRHLLNLINEVLDMSKIESGTFEMRNEAFNLAELIDNMVTMVLPQIRERSHTLKVNVGSLQHERVIGDSFRIQQAFTNLISNAVKYTPDGGFIQVTVTEREASVSGYGEYEFCFEDNGIGMSEDFQKILFEPFTRAEDSRLSKVSGTGLGMTITRNLIRMLDGNIQVFSKLGEGSKFVVTIHLKLQESMGENVEALKELPVLVVDDDESVCENTCLILKDIGMVGEWCLNGREAAKKVLARHRRRQDYFAVILDWKMPDMDGVATAREIRKQAGPDIPIIFLTAYDWSEIEAQARAAGVNRFLTKPLFKSRLIDSFIDIIEGDGTAGRRKYMEAETAKEEEAAGEFVGRRILLAEDNEINAEIARELLEMTGAYVEVAENGAMAVSMVEKAEEGYYDMIFMDIQMPVMDGYKAVAAIRSLPREDVQKIPIVAMTANAFAEDVLHAVSAGMNAHIAKPVDFARVKEMMKKYIL